QRETLGLRRHDIGNVAGGASLDERADHRVSERTGAAGDDHVAIAKIHGPAPLDSFVGILAEVTALLIEAKALLAHKAAEIGAGGFRVLARLVLRPAVEAGLSPAFGFALTARRPQR